MVSKRDFKRAKTELESPEMNLTPLLDVVFVVLIMFIIIAPMLEVDQVELAAAGQAGKKVSVVEESPITVHVKQDNTIWVKGSKVDPQKLLVLMKDAKSKHPKCKPQVFHDQRAKFGTYQEVKNTLEMAGFTEMDIVLKPS